jgi:hypothetical protein
MMSFDFSGSQYLLLASLLFIWADGQKVFNLSIFPQSFLFYFLLGLSSPLDISSTWLNHLDSDHPIILVPKKFISDILLSVCLNSSFVWIFVVL